MKKNNKKTLSQDFEMIFWNKEIYGNINIR